MPVSPPAQNLWRLVAKYPSTLLYPLLVLATVVGVGVWGITRVAHADIDGARNRGAALATEVAAAFKQQLTVATSPVISLAALVHYNPTDDFLSDIFPSFVSDLAKQVPAGALRSLQLAPLGVIRLVYPLESNRAAVGLDLFAAASERDVAAKTVADRQLTLAGPMIFRQGGYGVRVRMPIFVDTQGGAEGANVTFGGPDSQNPYCGAACYDPVTGSKFWGFATALIGLDSLAGAAPSPSPSLSPSPSPSPSSPNSSNSSAPPISSVSSISASDSRFRLSDLELRGYRYLLVAPRAAPNLRVIAGSATPPVQPEVATIDLPNAQWVLHISPSSGSWSPSWYPPLLAGVVVLGVALAAVLFAALVSRRQHQVLLEALLPRDVIRELVAGDTAAMGPHIMQADTPADVLLKMMGVLLEGGRPDLRDVLLIRTSVLRNLDIYQPMNLGSHIKGANLDAEVTRALMRQLGGSPEQQASMYDGVPDDVEAMMRRAKGGDDGDDGGGGGGGDACPSNLHDYSTLTGALALILTPHPAMWYDDGADINDAASDAALPTAGTECSVTSPSPSLAAISLGFGGIGIGGGAAPPSPLAAAMGSRQMSLNTPGAAAGDAANRSSRDFGSNAPQPLLSSTSGFSPMTSMTNFAAFLVPQRAATQPGCVGGIPGTSAAAVSAAVRAAIRGGGAGDDHLTSVCSSEAAEPVLYGGRGCGGGRNSSHHGGALRGGGGADDVSSAPLPVMTVPAAPHHQGSPRVGSQTPKSPLGAQRKRYSIQSTAQLPYGANSSGPLCLSATFSGKFSVGQVATPLPGDRPSVRAGGQVLPPGQGQGYGGASQVMLQSLNARRLGMRPPPSVIEEVERLLAQSDSWHFDTWKLREVTQGHPLSALGFYLIQRAGLIQRFKINPITLARLLRHVEAGYPDNPYHNAVHAADVLQTLHVILHKARLHVHYLDPLGLLAAYFAAIVHDYGHPGLTNDFLIATSDPLAVRYNDRSPLENHHAAAAFSVMRRPELDALAPLSAAERNSFRKQVIDLVLSTDMKQHFTVLSHFTTVHRLGSYTHAAAGSGGAGGTATPLSMRSSRTLHVEAERSISELAPKPKDDTERLLGLQLAMKAADLGHLGEELEVHQRWLSVLEAEFFLQGDQERELGLPISPLFDRSKQGVSKSQVGFYDFVALPLVHALSSAFPGAQPLMRCFTANYNHWRSVDGQPVVLHGANSGKQLCLDPAQQQQQQQQQGGGAAAGAGAQRHHHQQQPTGHPHSAAAGAGAAGGGSEAAPAVLSVEL